MKPKLKLKLVGKNMKPRVFNFSKQLRMNNILLGQSTCTSNEWDYINTLQGSLNLTVYYLE